MRRSTILPHPSSPPLTAGVQRGDEEEEDDAEPVEIHSDVAQTAHLVQDNDEDETTGLFDRYTESSGEPYLIRLLDKRSVVRS